MFAKFKDFHIPPQVYFATKSSNEDSKPPDPSALGMEIAPVRQWVDGHVPAFGQRR